MSMLRIQFPTPLITLITLIGVAASTMSCSVIIDTKTKQCSADADCSSLGAAFTDTMCDATQNICVAYVKGALGCQEAAKSSSATVTLSFGIGFLTEPQAPKDTVIRVCGGSADYQCDAPIGDPLTVKYGVVAEVPVPPGYQGVIEVKNPDALPSLYYLGRPIMQDTHGYDLTLTTPGTATLLGIATHHPEVDPALGGILVITTRDCDRQPLADVALSSDFDGAIQFYFQNRTPQPSLMATTAEGAAGYADVPEGFVSIGGTRDGRPLTGSAGYARAGWVTYMELFP
jgi:hypothetical protein